MVATWRSCEGLVSVDGRIDLPTPIFGQTSSSAQMSHFGLRAMQICRPWQIMRWLKSRSIRSCGSSAIRSRSIFTASVVPGQAQPAAEPADVRIDDHARGNAKGGAQHHVGRLAADARQAHQLRRGLAAPRRRAARRVAGSSLDALGLVAEEAGALNRLFQLRAAGPRRRRRRVGYLRNRSLVTMFTRTSVHWAERIVATSSSSGLLKSQSAHGRRDRASLSRAHHLGGMALGVGGRNHAGSCTRGWRSSFAHNSGGDAAAVSSGRDRSRGAASVRRLCGSETDEAKSAAMGYL